MRRVRFHRYGGPEVLRVEDAVRPEPGDGELLVKVEVVGITLPVVRQTYGDGAGGGVPLPCAPGGEVVGRVAAVGPGVTGCEIGQRVAGLAFAGAYAGYVAVPAAFMARVPRTVDDASAALLVRSGQVALGALRAAGLRSGESVLITAAAGGVGHLAVQLAKILGAGRVVGAVGSAAKAAFLRSLGADQVVVYDQPVTEWGESVDVVLDGVGGDVFRTSIAGLAPLGRLVTYNGVGGMVDVNQLRMQGASVIGFAMAHLASKRRDVYEQHQRELWELASSGALRPAIHQTLPLEHASEAHRIIESRENLGKVILRPHLDT